MVSEVVGDLLQDSFDQRRSQLTGLLDLVAVIEVPDHFEAGRSGEKFEEALMVIEIWTLSFDHEFTCQGDIASGARHASHLRQRELGLVIPAVVLDGAEGERNVEGAVGKVEGEGVRALEAKTFVGIVKGSKAFRFCQNARVGLVSGEGRLAIKIGCHDF